MRIHLLLLLTVLSGASTYAQYNVDLTKAMRVEVPPGLHVDSVIASFRDTACIGTIFKGTGHKKENVYLENGLSTALETLLRNGTVTESPVHCTMRVNALSVWEQEGYDSKKTYCGLNFELLAKTDSGWVRMYDHGATRSAHLSATGNEPLDAFIAGTIAQGFADYAGSKAVGLMPPMKMRWPPITGIYDGSSRDWPVLQVGAPARGLYRSFQEFRYQRPDTTCGFSIKTVGRDPDSPWVKVKPEKGCVLPEDCWGISDGKEAYFNMDGQFLRLNRSGPVFTARIETEVGSQAAEAAVGMAFGLIGGAIYGALMANRVQPISGNVEVELDMLTGSIKPLDQKEADMATSDQLFVYDNACPLDTTLEMFVFGGLEAKLRLGGHHWLKLVPRVNAVPVEFRVGQGAKATINIHTERVGGKPVVYTVCVESNDSIRVERLSREAAKDVVRSIDRGDEIK